MSSYRSEIRRLQEGIGALVAKNERKRSIADFSSYANDPVGFIRKELGGRPWSRQVEIAADVRDNQLVVVRAGNGLGKDWLAARLALWWVYARSGLCLVTGPTERQVKEIVMGEVRRAFAGAKGLPGELYELALRVDRTEHAGILAFTSNDASKLTGFHAPAVMVVITEAQGVEGYTFEAALANTTGEQSRILAVGNPLTPDGRFFQVSRSKNWRSHRISAFDHPNVQEGREIIPGAVTRLFVDTIAAEYGEGSGVYAARVLGDFPDEAEDTLCRRSWIKAANERWAGQQASPVPSSRPYVFALDPARLGPDSSVLALRQGARIVQLIDWKGRELMHTVGRVLEEVDRRGVERKRACIAVDEPGIGGGVVDRLRETGIDVQAFNGGRAAYDPEKFVNLRASAFWHLRRELEAGVLDLPPDEKLEDELCAIRWKVNSKGKIAIEPKDRLKERIGRSCDRADAVAIAFWAEDSPGPVLAAPIGIPKPFGSRWRVG